MAPFLVVGAGPSGLGCAWELARHGDVVVFDRIPVTGGSAGWSGPTMRRLTDLVTSRGVRLAVGPDRDAVRRRHSDSRHPHRLSNIHGRQLIVAGGLRPATAANLCIEGDRPAGVHAATVAEHLLRTGVRLWHTVVILGDGPWSQPVATMCRRAGTRVIGIAERALWADERIDPAPRLSIIGRQRITGVRLQRSSGDVTVGCDALVLSGDPRPNRNVTGALTEGDDNVVFHQPVRPAGGEDRFRAGSDAMRAWLQRSGGTP